MRTRVWKCEPVRGARRESSNLDCLSAAQQLTCRKYILRFAARLLVSCLEICMHWLSSGLPVHPLLDCVPNKLLPGQPDFRAALFWRRRRVWLSIERASVPTCVRHSSLHEILAAQQVVFDSARDRLPRSLCAWPPTPHTRADGGLDQPAYDERARHRGLLSKP